MYKIAICDDDKRYRKTIREIVEHENSLPENEIRFYEYESGNELLKHTDILHELVFIDIRMPGLDGNQTALKLRNYNKDAVLIFYSSYFEPTVDSINFGQPFRYIMKDLHDTSLRREIEAIMTEVKRRFLNGRMADTGIIGVLTHDGYMEFVVPNCETSVETPDKKEDTHEEEIEKPIVKEIMKIWKEVFEIEDISIQDDFYTLGGDSIILMRLVDEMCKTLGCDVTVDDILQSENISDLANRV